MSDQNPFGCPLVSQEEQMVGAEAIERYTKGIMNGQHARNAAYLVLSAVRSSHFNWEPEDVQVSRQRD